VTVGYFGFNSASVIIGFPLGVLLGLITFFLFREPSSQIKYLPILRLISIFQMLLILNYTIFFIKPLINSMNMIFDMSPSFIKFVINIFTIRLPEILFYMELFRFHNMELAFAGIFHSMLFKLFPAVGFQFIIQFFTFDTTPEKINYRNFQGFDFQSAVFSFVVILLSLKFLIKSWFNNGVLTRALGSQMMTFYFAFMFLVALGSVSQTISNHSKSFILSFDY
jgi:hypothetical protein